MNKVIYMVYFAFLFVAYSKELDLREPTQISGKMPGYTLEYKYYMATVSLRDEHDIHFCFGTAFFPRRILTAASCIYSKAHQEGFGGMYVMAGTSYNPQAGIPYFVQKINYSSHYENDNLNIRAIHDVGIITVTRNLIETIPISLNLEITQNDLAKAVIWHEDCSISLRDVEVLSYETHLLAIHPETSEFQPVNNDGKNAGVALFYDEQILGVRTLLTMVPRSTQYRYILLRLQRNVEFIQQFFD